MMVGSGPARGARADMVFERLGRQMYRRRRLVLGIWALILLGSVPFAPRLPSVLKAGGFANGTSESDRAVALLQDDLHWYASTLTIIYSSSRMTVHDAPFERAMQTSLAPLRRLPHV